MMQANPMPAYQLGDSSRLDKERYPFSWMTYNGEESYFCNFKSSSEGLMFQSEYQTVKNTIEDLNDYFQKKNSTMTLDDYRSELKDRWLPMVNCLERKWGKEFVPGDVRRAKNDVESNLQVPRTAWPDLPEVKRGE
jgi:hypothetical protein